MDFSSSSKARRREIGSEALTASATRVSICSGVRFGRVAGVEEPSVEVEIPALLLARVFEGLFEVAEPDSCFEREGAIDGTPFEATPECSTANPEPA